MNNEDIINSEKKIENNILKFIQNIVNNHTQKTNEYMEYINSETVNVDELIFSLNKVRLIQKLYILSDDVIKKHNIKATTDKCIPIKKDLLIKNISELHADIDSVLNKIQKAYNSSIDIDDDEEYYKLQNDIRKRRQKFRSYNKLCNDYIEAIENYVIIINAETSSSAMIKQETDKEKEIDLEPITINKPSLTKEQTFYDWLVSDGDVGESTAKQYISNIHSIEKLYQTIFGIRKNLLDFDSANNVKLMIKTLINRNEFIDANEKRHNSFSAALSKFAQFAKISIEGLKPQPERKVYKYPVLDHHNTEIVDFENPYNYRYCKPCSFTLNKSKYDVRSWRELYKKYLKLLYNNSTYFEILINLIGKPLYGQRIDFANKTSLRYLREPIQISSDFYAEGNLSSNDIIKHIRNLMEQCSIDNNNMIIEYKTQEKNDNTNEYNSFKPDITKPFMLKDALIEILSSNASEINNCREYRNGISSKSLRELLKEYYGKIITPFEISKLLMKDETFQSVGKECYVLNEEIIQQEKIVYQNDNSINILNELTIEVILEVIKENNDNLQYEDGFGIYEVKTLLAHKGIDVSEEQIETLMSECSELKEIEEGYYTLINSSDGKLENKITETISKADDIFLNINGNIIRVYDYSDALNKICEFVINCKPFKMARIVKQNIQINGNNVFYRKAVPVDGYNKLSNGLQIISIDNITELQFITNAVKKYCQIDNDISLSVDKEIYYE